MFWKKNLIEHFSVSGWAAIVTMCTNSKCRSSSYSTYLHTSSKYHKIIPLTDLQTKKQHFWFNHILWSLVPFEHFTHLDQRAISMKLLPFEMPGKVLKKPSSSYFVILFPRTILPSHNYHHLQWLSLLQLATYSTCILIPFKRPLLSAFSQQGHRKRVFGVASCTIGSLPDNAIWEF